MSGHLFVSRGNLLHLACDAILVPSGRYGDRFGHLTEPWTTLGLGADGEPYSHPAPSEDQRAVEVRPRASIQEPAIWVGHTGEIGRDAEWYAEAAARFIVGATRSFASGGEKVRPLNDARPLLALPLIGTGAGGIASDKGRAVQTLVDRILELLRDTVDADVVLVLRNDEGFAAAQQARARSVVDPWSELTAEDAQTAVSLGNQARQGRLVLFFGAGASKGAGLPSWSALLVQLAEAAELSHDDKRQLRQLPVLDQAVVLGRRLREQHSTIGAEIKRLMTRPRSSIVHQLLASLPVNEAATTNYDKLFEQAWIDAGRPHSVLPSQSAQQAAAWLLKLHGTIDEPDRIVLSREDYLRFESSDQALAGVVQAMLLTRHMLFVGYSLSDDNFHRLVHQVRAAVAGRPGDTEPFGTVLTPHPPALMQELWEGAMRYVSTGDDVHGARKLAILLDRIGAETAAPAGHLLDPTYEWLFSDDERRLGDALLEVRNRSRAYGVSDPVRRVVEDALGGFGGPGSRDGGASSSYRS